MSGLLPPDLSYQQKKRFLNDVRSYQLDEPFLYKIISDYMIRRYVSDEEISNILQSCYVVAYEGHFGGHRTTTKKLYNQVITDPLFLKILMSSLNIVTGAK